MNIKKIVLISAVALCVAIIAYPTIADQTQHVEEPTTGIAFIKQDFDQALLKAGTDNKLIFVDAYASWCGPCKMMDKKVFTDKEVADFFNQNFINLKMMVENGQSATPEGVKFAQRFEFDAYPTFFFIDKNGNVVHQIVGYFEGEDLLKEAQKALKKIE